MTRLIPALIRTACPLTRPLPKGGAGWGSAGRNRASRYLLAAALALALTLTLLSFGGGNGSGGGPQPAEATHPNGDTYFERLRLERNSAYNNAAARGYWTAGDTITIQGVLKSGWWLSGRADTCQSGATGKGHLVVSVGDNDRNVDANFTWNGAHIWFSYTVVAADRDYDGVSAAANSIKG